MTSGHAAIQNNRESITIDKCSREGVTGTGGYRHTAFPQQVTSVTLMRIVQLSEDGRVSAVLPERSDDLDPPAREEVVELSEDGLVSVVCPERLVDLDPPALEEFIELSEDGHVSVVLPERLVDLDPPALEEFVELSEDGRVSVVLPERSDELGPRAHISVDRLKQFQIVHLCLVQMTCLRAR